MFFYLYEIKDLSCLLLIFQPNNYFFFVSQEENELDERNNKNEILEQKSDGEIENVRVVVRIRPMDKIEIDSGNENVIKVDKLNRCVTVYKPNAAVGEPPRIYYFDNVFDEHSSQVCTI